MSRMSVDERTQARVEGAGATRGEAPRRPGRVRLILAGIALAVLGSGAALGVVAALSSIDLLPDLRNPFSTDQVDRSRPAVLQTLSDLQEYRAASGHFEVIVDIEEDARFVPSFLAGERTLFVAVGDVDARVDFSGLDAGAVQVDDDGSSVQVVLPSAQLTDPDLDTDQSYVYDRQRGLANRVASLFDDDPDAQQELYRLAERRIAAAADGDERILRRAERNTAVMLEGLLGAAGFQTVDVRFE